MVSADALKPAMISATPSANMVVAGAWGRVWSAWGWLKVGVWVPPWKWISGRGGMKRPMQCVRGVAWRGVAGRGRVWCDMVRCGEAGLGVAWQGGAWCFVKAGLDASGRGVA